MLKRTIIILLSVAAAVVVATGLGVLIWWLVTRGVEDEVTVIRLEGEGIGDLEYTAAFTKIPNVGDIFWWFYPTVDTEDGWNRPLILWVDGATGIPPSLLANLGMFGPYDINFNRRNDSWVDQFNLLFIDAPLGTGFSTTSDSSRIPRTIEENAEHLAITLESFYTLHEEYRNASLYIFGQAHGAQLAVALAVKLSEAQQEEKAVINLRGVAIGNGIISPALAMTKLGFYLEELGYIDGNGRVAIEMLSEDTNNLVNTGYLEDAFDNFITLGQFVNDNATAVAVNLGHIVEKLTRSSYVSHTSTDYFGQRAYLKDKFNVADFDIMNNIVAPALGVPSDITYDSRRDDVIYAMKSSFMAPAVEQVEYILQNTELTVAIYNGNLDAVSNTPGQLEWINNLQWSGQTEFRERPRETLVVNRLIEGYFRETPRLKFYWINVAGQSVPLDNPTAMRTILPRIVSD